MKFRFVFYIFCSGLLLFVIACGPQKKQSRIAYEAGDFAAAISYLKTELASDSTDSQGWLLLGDSYEKMQKADSAIWAYERGYQINPGTSDIRKALVRLYIAKAKSLREEKDFGRAIRILEKAEELAPKQFDVFFEKGETYLAAGYLEKAKNEYRKAQEIAAKDPRPEQRMQQIAKREAEAEALLKQGKAQYDRKRWDRAIRILEKAVAQNAENPEAKYYLHMARGRRLYKKGSVNALWDAITEFGYATNIRPNSAEPLYYMGLAYEKKDRNDFTMPVEVYQKVLEIEPEGEFAKKAKKRIRYLTNLKTKLEKFWGKKRKK